MKHFAPLLFCLVLIPAGSGFAQVGSQAAALERKAMREAKGHFTIQMTPQPSSIEGVTRQSFAKEFHGAIEGRSDGEMLSVRTPTAGSAGYVLIEHVTGAVNGRSGAFMIQQFGLMDRRSPELRADIIPDSGTGDLFGIKGTMKINPAEAHSYILTYSLPNS